MREPRTILHNWQGTMGQLADALNYRTWEMFDPKLDVVIFAHLEPRFDGCVATKVQAVAFRGDKKTDLLDWVDDLSRIEVKDFIENDYLENRESVIEARNTDWAIDEAKFRQG